MCEENYVRIEISKEQARMLKLFILFGYLDNPDKLRDSIKTSKYVCELSDDEINEAFKKLRGTLREIEFAPF